METLQWIIQSVSYWHVFFILFISGLGFPVPEEITLMAAGAAAAMGDVKLIPMIIICYVAIIGGDTVAFASGRAVGDHVMESRFARWFISKKRLRKARFLFYKRGTWAVVVARFLPGLRVSAFFVAGTMKVSWARFLAADSLALFASAPIGLGLGWFLGSNLLTPEGFAYAERVLRKYHVIVGIAIGILVATFIGLLIYRRYVRKRSRRTRNSDAPLPEV